MSIIKDLLDLDEKDFIRKLVNIVSGDIHNIATEIAKDFNELNLEYCIIGGIALAPYNFSRATEDVDFLVSKKAFKTIESELIGRGYTFIPGSKKNMWYHSGTKKTRIDILIEGDRNNGQLMPNPLSVRKKISGVWYLSLTHLIEFKIIAGRPQDLVDVIRLIKENSLDKDFSLKLDNKLRTKFLELYNK